MRSCRGNASSVTETCGTVPRCSAPGRAASLGVSRPPWHRALPNGEVATISTSAISSNIHHTETVAGIYHCQEDDGECSFIIVEKGATGGRGLDHYMLSINSPNAVWEIPQLLEISWDCSPALILWWWHVFPQQVFPDGLTTAQTVE